MSRDRQIENTIKGLNIMELYVHCVSDVNGHNICITITFSIKRRLPLYDTLAISPHRFRWFQEHFVSFEIKRGSKHIAFTMSRSIKDESPEEKKNTLHRLHAFFHGLICFEKKWGIAMFFFSFVFRLVRVVIASLCTQQIVFEHYTLYLYSLVLSNILLGSKGGEVWKLIF